MASHLIPMASHLIAMASHLIAGYPIGIYGMPRSTSKEPMDRENSYAPMAPSHGRTSGSVPTGRTSISKMFNFQEFPCFASCLDDRDVFFCFVAFYFPFPRFLVQTRSSGTLQRTVLTNDCLPGNPPGAAMMSHAHSLRLFPVPGWGVFLRPIVPNRFFLRSTRVSSARIACLARAACAGVTVPWTETVGRVERESGESFFVPGRPV